MIAVHRAEESKRFDNDLIEKKGFSSLLLMETAAHEFVRLADIKKGSNIGIIVGTGNNGGDGLAIARLLSKDNLVVVYYIGDFKKATLENQTNLIMLRNYPVKIEYMDTKDLSDISEIGFDHNVFIDALFGIGFKGVMQEFHQELIGLINEFNAKKYSVDIPSGLNADDEIDEDVEIDDLFFDDSVFVADVTISMFGWKKAFVNKDNWVYTGNIIHTDLSLPEDTILSSTNQFILEKEDIRNILFERNLDSNKFDFGIVVSLCGSKEMPGAGTLAANSAMEIGAGFVFAINNENNGYYPEIIRLPQLGNESIESNPRYNFIFEKDCVILAGCGIGRDSKIISMLPKLLSKSRNSYFILDGDALYDISKLKLSKNVILTPHYFEFERMTDYEIEDIEVNPAKCAIEFANKMNCILVLKGPTTIITDGKKVFYNVIGNSGLSKAGSGDALAGSIAGIIAQTYTYTEDILDRRYS